MGVMNFPGETQRFSKSVRGWFFLLPLLTLAVAVFSWNTCAGNQVAAWGAGKFVTDPPDEYDWGQSMVPADLTNAAEVAGGWQQSVALKSDGTLECWGGDNLGQTDFPPASNYTAIACGDNHSLALISAGTVVVASAYDFYGEADVPADLSNVVAVACGFYHCLALKADGTLAAWGGTNDPGVEYGQGQVPNGLTNVVAIAAGGYDNLVLQANGTLFAWGANSFGETNIPAGLSNVVAIAVGDEDNLVLKSDGTVAAWGNNEYGETNVPPGLSNVVAIAAGRWHDQALKSNGTVVAWGDDSFGETNIPPNLTNVIQIAAGDAHSLALVGRGPPITRAALLQPRFGTNGFSVSVPAQNGRVYQLQYQNSLTNGVWQSLPLRAGVGGNLQLTDPALVSQRFYRVERW